jgi:murein DD-endopeptidase MepM/ murein hydrolase activator NlpD
MANDFYTLIVVPHAKAQFRKFEVSVRLLKRAAWTGGVASALSVVTLGYVFYDYARLRVDRTEVVRLRAENADLLKFKEDTPKLQEKVVQLQSLVNKFGVMAGVEQTIPGSNPETNPGGVGGATSLESAAPSNDLHPEALQKMDKTLSTLLDRSKELEAFYRDQKVLLASTPSVWPVRGYLSANFGNRMDPFTGQRDFHPGIDISTPLGTKVLAPADGVVLSCGPKGAYGNAIQIDHGYDIVTRYGHLSAFNVKPGQRVHRGEVIGFVGNTGRSTAPHLHYEVWVRDQTQNPIHFILDEYRSFG